MPERHLPDPPTSGGVRPVRADRRQPHGDGLADTPDGRPSSRETPDDRGRRRS